METHQVSTDVWCVALNVLLATYTVPTMELLKSKYQPGSS